jgi:hypothetical protein
MIPCLMACQSYGGTMRVIQFDFASKSKSKTDIFFVPSSHENYDLVSITNQLLMIFKKRKYPVIIPAGWQLLLHRSQVCVCWYP